MPSCDGSNCGACACACACANDTRNDIRKNEIIKKQDNLISELLEKMNKLEKYLKIKKQNIFEIPDDIIKLFNENSINNDEFWSAVKKLYPRLRGEKLFFWPDMKCVEVECDI